MAVKKLFSNARSVYAHRLKEIETNREKFPEQMYGVYLEMSIAEKSKCENYFRGLDEAVFEPIAIDKKWLYQDTVYEVSGSYTDNEKKFLILEHADKERQKFERLEIKFSADQTENIKHERTRIPENVRIEVWRRDQGKCASCGNREKLEYDHIVAVSRGGSNTARNVELLCEVCNRAKGDRIQ